jgi:hypothetical protein
MPCAALALTLGARVDVFFSLGARVDVFFSLRARVDVSSGQGSAALKKLWELERGPTAPFLALAPVRDRFFACL